jgi:hypothetical protein
MKLARIILIVHLFIAGYAGYLFFHNIPDTDFIGIIFLVYFSQYILLTITLILTYSNLIVFTIAIVILLILTSILNSFIVWHLIEMLEIPTHI